MGMMRSEASVLDVEKALDGKVMETRRPESSYHVLGSTFYFIYLFFHSTNTYYMPDSLHILIHLI